MNLSVCDDKITAGIHEFCLEPLETSIETLNKEMEECLKNKMVIPLGYIQKPRMNRIGIKKFYSYQPREFDFLDICLSPWQHKAYIVVLYPEVFRPIFMVTDASEEISVVVSPGKGEKLRRSNYEYTNKNIENIFNIPIVQRYIPSGSYKGYH